MKALITLLAPVLALALLSGCQMIYKLPTRQGNVLEQKQLDQLQTGMTRDQVRFLLGTPLAASPFRSERWDYIGYYKSPRGEEQSRTVSLFFDADRLSRMEGVQMAAAATDALTNPDAKAVAAQQKKDQLEDSRAESAPPSGIIMTPTDPSAPAPDKLPNP